MKEPCKLCGDDPEKKLICSAVHPELLPEGYYYQDGYLFDKDGKPAFLKTAQRLPVHNGKIVLDRNNPDHVKWAEGYDDEIR